MYLLKSARYMNELKNHGDSGGGKIIHKKVPGLIKLRCLLIIAFNE